MRASLVLLPLALFACTPAVSAPLVAYIPARSDAFQCLLGAVNRAGFTVLASDPAGGLLRAERQLPERTAQTYRVWHLVTASVHGDSVRISGERSSATLVAGGSGREAVAPSAELRADVEALATTCRA